MHGGQSYFLLSLSNLPCYFHTLAQVLSFDEHWPIFIETLFSKIKGKSLLRRIPHAVTSSI